MNITVNPKSPVPLYHQIAEALSYQIATEQLAAGQTLPSVRRMAQILGVNMHTVRRAYTELSGRGLVISKGALGTIVAGSASGSNKPVHEDKLEQFLGRVIQESREKFELSRHELVQRLGYWGPLATAAQEFVYIIEGSESQGRDYASRIEGLWQVEARPWILSDEGELPEGPAVATYFHYNEIRRRWPQRFNAIHFITARPDPGLRKQIEALARFSGGSRLVICEFDQPAALNAAADLQSLLGATRFTVETRVVNLAGIALRSRDEEELLVFPPRVWAELTAAEQSDLAVFRMGYELLPEDLHALGNKFGWRPMQREAAKRA
ncbi:MAG: GntR family transcriptional regulator [Candidatus Marinimicrobia bacterium]|nr:GntR family transcriptional regulator [Candidatus Neomarinimicrobiota bacterium]